MPLDRWKWNSKKELELARVLDFGLMPLFLCSDKVSLLNFNWMKGLDDGF